MTEPIDIHALRRLLAEAESPRPWELIDMGERFGRPGTTFMIGGEDPLPGQPDETCVTDELQACVDMDSAGQVKAGNGSLIVAAVNALPAILDRLEEAERLLGDAEEWIDYYYNVDAEQCRAVRAAVAAFNRRGRSSQDRKPVG